MAVEKDYISVIVPIYKGIQYIKGLIIQIEAAATEVSNEVELILVNDYPDEPINELYFSDIISISVIQTNINRGIQGARVIGLNSANGKYVLFLDQDDTIAPIYFKSQLNAIGEADVCVCNCIVNGKGRYADWRESLDDSITEKYNVEVGCGFTVGQALIKKESISEFWKNNWLMNNYCDDYYLWLCMFSEGRRFVPNPEVLYEHINTGANQSDDYSVWFKSSLEMLQKLALGNIFSDKRIKLIRNNIDIEAITYLNDIKFLKQKNWAYARLLSLSDDPNRFRLIAEKMCFTSHGVAVYGADLGIHLCNLMKRNYISPICIVDRNADNIRSDMRVFPIEEVPKTVTMIISTIFKESKIVEDKLKKLYPYIKYCHINEVLNDSLVKHNAI